MSVLKEHRLPSEMEYVRTTVEICTRTIDFLSKLSARYSRLVAPKVAAKSMDLMFHAIEAEHNFPSTLERAEIRKNCLLSAQSELKALDVGLALVYDILVLNPQGAFTTSKGETVKSGDAIDKLNNMSLTLGGLIDVESDLLKGVLRSDSERDKKDRRSMAAKSTRKDFLGRFIPHQKKRTQERYVIVGSQDPNELPSYYPAESFDPDQLPEYIPHKKQE